MNKFYFLYLLAILFGSCKTNQNVERSAVAITEDADVLLELTNTPIEINLDQFEYISPLNIEDVFAPPVKVDADETTISNFGGFITFYANSNYMVLSDGLFSLVTLADQNGKFIRYIGEKGNDVSRGKFTSPRNVAIDTLSGIMYILSGKKGGHHIFKYQLNGKYIGHIPLQTGEYDKDIFAKGLLCDGIDVDNRGNLLIHYAYWDGNKSDANYCIYDQTGKKINELKTLESTFTYGIHDAISAEYGSYIYNKTLHAIDASGKIYSVKDGQFTLKYILKSKNSIDALLLKDKNAIISPMRTELIVETHRYLFLRICDYDGYIMGIYDKESNKFFKTKERHLFESKSNGKAFHLMPGSQNNNIFYSFDTNSRTLYKLYLKNEL